MTYHSEKDVTLSSSLGSVSFTRYYAGDWRAWPTGTKTSAFLPVPFGNARGSNASLNWWHEYYSYVDQTPTKWQVRMPGGTTLDYVPCVGSPCYAQLMRQSREATHRLLYSSASGGSFVLEAPDKQYSYAAKWTAPDGGEPHYFLSAVSTAQTPLSQTLATVLYATPDAGSCPSIGPGGVPYVSAVRTAEGNLLEFNYARLQSGLSDGGKAPNECVLSQVSLRGYDAGTRTAVATYSYESNRAGLLASATLPLRRNIAGTQVVETYGYPPADGGFFTASEESVVTVRHATNKTGSVQKLELLQDGTASASTEWLRDGGNFVYNTGCPTFNCTDISMRAEAASTGGSGATNASFGVMAVTWAPPYGQGRRTLSWSDDGGQTKYISTEYATSRAITNAVQDRRGNWTVYEAAVNGSVDAGIPPLEVNAIRRGATDQSGTGYLERVAYSYTYPDGRTPSVDTRSWPSALGGAVTEYTRYDASSSRVRAVIREGVSQSFDGTTWTTSTRYEGTFYRTSSACAGGAADPLARTLEIHGPCRTGSGGSTECNLGAHPITRFEYYPSTDTSPNRNQLKSVSRYPSVNHNAVGVWSCGSVELKTTYAGYNAYGQPTSITDENGVVTTLNYTGDKLTSRVVNGKTWSYAWDNEKLAGVGSPDGDWDVYCYRNTTGACTTSASWTGKLKYQAKCSNSTCSTTPPEQIRFEYWANGSLKRRSTVDSAGSVRTDSNYAPDPLGRLTWESVGTGGSGIATKRAYDSEDNMEAVGAAFTGASDFCRTSGTLDPRCRWMTYDRASRLSRVDVHPTGAVDATKSSRTCIEHDGRGNVTRVLAGIQSGGTETCSYNGTTADAGTPSTLPDITYVYDDFDRVIQVNAPWNGYGGSTWTKYEYSPMGRVLKRQTAQMSSGSMWEQKTYDMLGRLLNAFSETSSGQVGLQVLRYDVISSTPSGCTAPTNLMGRLATITDSFGVTYLSYTPEGWLKSEQRLRSGITSCGSVIDNNPSTSYSYSNGGRLGVLTYPDGRSVTYSYGAGALAGRVAGISVKKRVSGAWVDQALISNVAWEPYGDVRSYYFVTGASTNNRVDYGMSATVTAPMGSGTCSTWTFETTSPDGTGRMRELFVSTGTTTTGNLLKQFYSWNGEMLANQQTCFTSLSQTTGHRQDFTYDKAGRLTGVGGQGMPVRSGATYGRTYEYDRRDNRANSSTAVTVDGCANNYQLGSGKAADLLNVHYPTSSCVGIPGPTGPTDYYDADGRNYYSATAYSWWSKAMGYAPHAGDGAIDAVYKSVTLPNGTYEYYYDYAGRRRMKIAPWGDEEETFYGTNNQMLSVVADDHSEAMDGKIYDDHVWLGQRLVAVIRGKIDSGNSRLDDNYSDCSRWWDTYNRCGIYHVVTDYLPKPILMFEASTGYTTGTGLYDEFGRINYIPLNRGVNAPAAATTVATATLPTITGATSARLFVDMADMPNAVELRFAGNYVTSGPAQAHIWSQWLPSMPASPSATVSAGYPGYNGVQVGGVEYQQQSSAFSTHPFFTSLRFPGHWFDEETDMFQNWNRFYDPSTGRYTSPEPNLSIPSFTGFAARRSISAPAYSYAAANPVVYTDKDGLTTLAPNAEEVVTGAAASAAATVGIPVVAFSAFTVFCVVNPSASICKLPSFGSSPPKSLPVPAPQPKPVPTPTPGPTPAPKPMCKDQAGANPKDPPAKCQLVGWNLGSECFYDCGGVIRSGYLASGGGGDGPICKEEIDYSDTNATSDNGGWPWDYTVPGFTLP